MGRRRSGLRSKMVDHAMGRFTVDVESVQYKERCWMKISVNPSSLYSRIFKRYSDCYSSASKHWLRNKGLHVYRFSPPFFLLPHSPSKVKARSHTPHKTRPPTSSNPLVPTSPAHTPPTHPNPADNQHNTPSTPCPSPPPTTHTPPHKVLAYP